MDRVCYTVGCVPEEVVSGDVAGGSHDGGIPGDGVVTGAAVAVIGVVNCSSRAS